MYVYMYVFMYVYVYIYTHIHNKIYFPSNKCEESYFLSCEVLVDPGSELDVRSISLRYTYLRT